MKQFTWEEYYNSFYDWSLSTQKNYSYGITNYGSADEVFEILSEFAFYDKKFASRFADKAIDAGVKFTPEQVLEIEGLIDKTVFSKMAEHVSKSFTEEELEEIYMLIDDDAFNRICEKQGVDIFADDSENISCTEQDYSAEELFEEDTFEISKKKKHSPWLFAFILAVAEASSKNRKRGHNGKCDGDCANCPPHYGYRYGRWYYGHGHVRGCVFGGNKGDGSLPY